MSALGHKQSGSASKRAGPALGAWAVGKRMVGLSKTAAVDEVDVRRNLRDILKLSDAAAVNEF
jgi:hypothetical protein